MAFTAGLFAFNKEIKLLFYLKSCCSSTKLHCDVLGELAVKSTQEINNSNLVEKNSNVCTSAKGQIITSGICRGLVSAEHLQG